MTPREEAELLWEEATDEKYWDPSIRHRAKRVIDLLTIALSAYEYPEEVLATGTFFVGYEKGDYVFGCNTLGNWEGPLAQQEGKRYRMLVTLIEVDQ